MVELSIILVNYNTAIHTINCINSIIDQTRTISYEIIVVDNASHDKSYELITSTFPQVRWIQNEINEGFGRANNIGILQSHGRYILLLNTDTIVIYGAIEKAVERFKNEANNLGLATCQLINPDYTPQKSVFEFNASYIEILNNNLLVDFLLRWKNSNKKRAIKALHGAFLLFEKDRLTSVGFFDPDFFLYSEEFEWCYRIEKKGFELRNFHNISVIHLEEGSSKNKDWNIKQRYLSGALLFKKTHGNTGLMIYLALCFVNLLTNMLLMWKLNSRYRTDFMSSQKKFWGLTLNYLTILLGIYNRPLKYVVKK